MKQLTYILLMIGVVQLLLTVCAVEGKKHRSDKSDRSERGRAAKKGAAKKKGGEKLESEDICTKGDECQSGNCCPIPLDPKRKACFKQDCNNPKYGNAATANPPIHEWNTTEKWYKMYIKDQMNLFDAVLECCKWKTNGRLALVDDQVYDNVFAEIVNGMKTLQNANKPQTNLESTVMVDGVDIDMEGKYYYAFTDGPKSYTLLESKYWYTVKGEPNHSTDNNCIGIKHWSSAAAKYKFATISCYTPFSFLCEASKKPTKDGGASKKKAPGTGKKKAPDAGKKKKGK